MTFCNFYKRDKLYEEVWSEPVTAVAERYGVSDVAIHHACKRLEVPVPPRGYWAKLAAGKNPRRKRLPAHDGPQIIWRPQPRPTRPKPAPIERLAFLEERERTKALQLCDNLQVKDRLTSPHKLIKQDREVRAEHKRKERERKPFSYLDSNYNSDRGFWSTWYKKILDINVQPNDMPRAYRLLNAIFHKVEELGGQVKLDDSNGNTQIVWLGETMRIRLRSKEHDLALMIEDYHAPRKNWRDTKTKRIESEAGSFVVGLLECAHVLRTQREERRREEQLRRQQELEQLERERLEREETARFQILEKNALDWRNARAIEQYVTELEKRVSLESDAEKKEKLLDYIAWAKGKVDWLDPFVAREDPLLGKRHDDCGYHPG